MKKKYKHKIENDKNRDVWLTLENGQYECVAEVRKLYEEYVGKDYEAEAEVPYIDTLSREGHKVFVSEGLYKMFGNFVGSNSKERAIVTFDNKAGCHVFDADRVIST